MKRTVLSICCMVLAFASAMAANRLYIEDFSIDAGETKQVAVFMENDDIFTGFQFDLVLPEGLTIETKNNGDPKVTINTDRADDHQTITNFRDDGRISILLMSLASTEIYGNYGEVLYLKLTADENFSGNHSISLINIEMTTPAGVAVNPSDSHCQVAGPVTVVDLTGRLYIEDFTIDAGETKEIAVLMENESTFTGFQFDLVLPEGLTIETKNNGDPKVTINTDRADDHQTVTNFRDDGRISILLMSLSSSEIMGNSGPIIYLNLTASNDFNGIHQISVINAEMTTPNGNALNPDDTYCSVTGVNAGGESHGSLLELNTKMAKLPLDQTIQLAVTTPDAGAITWTSEDETVATVDANGLVTAVNPGMVAIHAVSASGDSTWCAVWSYLPGDANEDCIRDISDVTLLISWILTQ